MQNFIKVFGTLLATILLSLSISAQSITELQADLNHIKLSLEQHHKQYKIGSSLIITGLIASSSGMVINVIANKPENQSNGSSKTDKAISNSLIIVGGGLALAGWIVQIDSHKYFKRAAVGFTSNGLTLNVDL
ncbi:MAG: hypothetical protein PHC38_04220 [Weeksellaceae bacterium]|nr:hypothetical protein [Weeksellaceae bacterium]